MAPREYSDILIDLYLEKSDKALEAANLMINNELFESALNRIYYAIFYTVSALGEKNDFVSSKHSGMMSWFNRKYVNDEKKFSKDISEIYRKTFKFREKGDYDPRYHATFEETNEILNQAKKFIEIVRKEI